MGKNFHVLTLFALSQKFISHSTYHSLTVKLHNYFEINQDFLHLLKAKSQFT
ncbi:hypothetical protein PSPO_a2796 [Pseudoalteromonas spongiae UST010723-006]|nr:hypothetical protein PSPO_a2796 [Pseudoalteromonas spongiae UST010723-006]